MRLKIAAMLLVLAMAFSVTAVLSGCGEDSGETVTVQSISMITDAGNTGVVDRMAGKVISSNTLEIYKKSDQKVVELNVKVGDEVRSGEILFSYDEESLKLAHEKLLLEKEQYENLIKTINQKIDSLKRSSNSGSEEARLENSIQLQTAQIELKEAEYQLAGMDDKIKEAEELIDKADYVIDIDGRVQSVNEEGTGENGEKKPFITVVETGAFRVEAKVSEMNLSMISVGDRVIVRSRSDKNRIWHGEISQIKLDTPESGSEQSGYYDGYYSGNQSGDSMTQTSSYPFYVTLDDAEGLILGQHVFVEPDVGQTEEREGIWLPSYYICDIESDPYVWRANKRSRLEKAPVVLGTYDHESDSYEIVSGIDENDYLAFAGEDLAEGMKTAVFDESSFNEGDEGEFMGEDMPADDYGTMEGIDDYGAYEEYEGEGDFADFAVNGTEEGLG